MSGTGKKDLTGLHELPPADPVVQEGVSEFSLNEAPSIEQVDQFEPLDQIGMMDHPAPPEEPPAMESEAMEVPPLEAQNIEPQPMESHSVEPQAPDSLPPTTPDPFAEPPLILEELRSYGESRKAAPFQPGIRVDFHLQISGEFDPYARDKLLLFITDHPIGMTSSELDFQIQAGRVLLPRISEFSGIKLIQELRDSGLRFALTPSSTEEAFEQEPRITHFGEGEPEPRPEIPVLPENAIQPDEYRVMDSLQLVHYLRAEILEVEKSELFQELLERMTSALKKRAELKGAHALTRLQHRITPLRLPSQYQVELSASLLRRVQT
jgi:hypothetical protein